MHLLPLLLSSLSAGIAAASAIPSKILFSRADRTSPVLVDDSWKRISDDYSARRGFASVTRINRWTETIPNDCYKEAFDKTIDPGNGNNNRRCPSLNDLNVFEVWFSDAAEPWLVCRCKNSYITEGELLKKVGRIPIGVRQHTRYIMMFRNGGKGVNGLANSRGDVIFFGKTDMKTYIHEFAHQVDRWGERQGPGRHSLTAEFQNAVKRDACWPSTYARKHSVDRQLVEPWAEVFTFREIMKRTPVPNWSCMSNQLNLVMAQTDRIADAGYNEAEMMPYGLLTVKRSDMRGQVLEPIVKASWVRVQDDPDYICSGGDE